MTVTLTKLPRDSVIIRANECTNPRIASQTGWTNLWFGAGGSGIATADGTQLKKEWQTAPTNLEDAGWEYDHLGWAGDYVQKTVSGYLYPYLFEPKVAIKAFYYNKDGGLIRYDTSAVVQYFLNDGWKRISATFQCPPGTTHTKVRFCGMPGNNPQAGNALALQRVLIEPGATVSSYFDGTTFAAGNGTQSTKWEGTADASRSLLYDADPANVISPDGTEGWDQASPTRNVFIDLLDGTVAAVLQPAGPRRGTLKLLFGGAGVARAAALAAAQNAAAQLKKQGSFQYLDDTLGTLTNFVGIVNGDVRLYVTDTRNAWRIDVPYQEAT